MIQLLPRTFVVKQGYGLLYQQAYIPNRTWAPLDPATVYPVIAPTNSCCDLCYFNHPFESWRDFANCAEKNRCGLTCYPWIAMFDSRNGELSGTWGTEELGFTSYQDSRIYKQVMVEGQPNHVRLIAADSDGALCNALCYFHAWRLKNKKTWRQCGKTHGCGNNGSAYDLCIPVRAVLKEEFLNNL